MRRPLPPVVRPGVTFRPPAEAPPAPAVEPLAAPLPAPTAAVPAPAAAPPDDGAAVLPPPVIGGSAFRQRYGTYYDTHGPKVRVGVLWALAVAGSLALRPLRPYGLAVLFAGVAGAAAAQILDAHIGRDTTTDRRLASFAASALPILATAGARVLGIGVLGLVLAAVVGTVAAPEPGRAPLARAGHVVAAALLCGGAAASLVLLADYEIGAVIILLTLVLVYDACDFIVGSGATNGVEGPLAGIIFMVVGSCLVAELKAPPFHGADVWPFAVFAMLACPAGQILASALLPQPASRAPALRRLDSFLIVAPAWAGLVGLYLTHVH